MTSKPAPRTSELVGPALALVLEADAELAEAAPLGRGEAAVDLEQERLDPRPHLRRRVGAGERARKVAARHLVGAEAEIEDAELEPDPRQGGVVEKHALERADRRLVVAGRGRDLGEPEGQVEICRLAQHLREHRIVFRAGDDALRLGRCAQELGAERRRGDAQEPGTKLGSSCRHAPLGAGYFLLTAPARPPRHTSGSRSVNTKRRRSRPEGRRRGAIGLSLWGIGNGRGAVAEIEAGATCPYIGRRSRRDRRAGRKPWLTFD